MEPNIENISNNKIESREKLRLQELEAEGKWVFHGSGSKIEVLEPRQAHNHTKDGVAIPDDKPAVFASPSADIAIFMSIFNKNNAPKGSRSGFGNKDGHFEFRVTPETLEQINNAVGYVYIFNKDNFISRSSTESLSYESVKPVEVIMVSEKDLPKGIVIKDF